MRWLLSRLFLAGFASAFAGGLGFLISGPSGLAIGVSIGAVAALLAVVALDARRASQLMRWLQGSMQDAAPRDTGLWGELAYRAERALRGLEHDVAAERTRLSQFVAAMDASPNGVLLLDADDVIEWCNARAAGHFGLDPERDRRQRITNLIRSPSFVAYLQAGVFGEPVTIGPPERKGTLQVTIRTYDSDRKKLILSQDQTERERADALRRDFVANVSHELRTPLTVLAGFLETMRNLPLSEAEQKRVLAMMSQQSDRMTNLVGDLLALARLEGSPRPALDHWVPVAALFGQVEAAARSLSAGRHEIVFADASDVSVAGSESELLSAIGNLASNAVRYTQDGGRVDVAFELEADGAGAIVVADNGRGVPAEHLPRLTERFYRVDSGRSRESGGTGLGLAIVKHVAQRHGGELAIESELGKGSTFRLLLPAARVRTAHESSGSMQAAAEALAAASSTP